MDSPHSDGIGNITSRVQAYKKFDVERQNDLEQLAEQCLQMKTTLSTIQADLEDERATRRNWRKRAEDAENAMASLPAPVFVSCSICPGAIRSQFSCIALGAAADPLQARNPFVLVLVDADGYIFREVFLKEASGSGGAQAAHQLYIEVQNYVRSNNVLQQSEYHVMVNIYANKTGLAKALHEAGLIGHPTQLDAFYTSFTRSQPLTQFIDCGPGKERADTKLRGKVLTRASCDPPVDRGGLTRCRYLSLLWVQQSLPSRIPCVLSR